MKFQLTVGQKLFILFVSFMIAVIGFMMKLPSGFRHIDKELHTAFYFLAAAFLNILFLTTKLTRHLIIFVSLFLFGMAIEYGQQYSNRFFHKRIHGRYDPEDLQSNLNGLLAFSALWAFFTVVIFLYRKSGLKNEGYDSKAS